MPKNIVIVGGVAGGASCAARLRRGDENAAIVLLERGEHVSFANCGLPYFIGGEIADRSKLFVTSAKRMMQRFRIDVRTRQEAIAIDRNARTVLVRNHESGEEYTLAYDALVLSPGAEPLRPPIPGIDGKRVFSLRNVPDADAIRQYVKRETPRRAVVVGGGFIGLEMAENLVHLGLAVTLVEMAPQVMPPLDPEMAEWLHQHLRHRKLDLRLGNPVEAFEEQSDGGLSIHIRGGERVHCDIAIAAIGVKPEVELARAAGLDIGPRGGIRVDAGLRTSDPRIYAIGDAIEVRDAVTGDSRLVPLAGPANRQGRLAADAICGRAVDYGAVQGTGIVRVFDLVAAATGAAEKSLKAAHIPYVKSYTHPASHAGYFPGAVPMVMKLLFTPDTGRLLGAQIVGVDGVDKRIDVLSTAIKAGMTIEDLTGLELAYAPQFGTGKDAVNLAGYAASNVLAGDIDLFYAEEVEARVREGGFLLDVRTTEEFEEDGHIDGAVNIPIDSLRERLDEIPADRPILVYCLTGIRSYYICCILRQTGRRVRNLSGGYMVYCAVNPARCHGIPELHLWRRSLALETFCSTPQYAGKKA